MCFLLLFLQGCAFGDIDGLYHEEAKTEITDSEETRAPEAKVENIVSANEMMTVEQEPEDERAMFENCYYYEQLSESQKCSIHGRIKAADCPLNPLSFSYPTYRKSCLDQYPCW